MPPYIQQLHERWKSFAETKAGKRTIRIARLLFVIGIVALLVHQVSGIGWRSVLASLPTTPYFYLILLALYFLLPATEAVIYGRLWKMRVRRCFAVMIRKRVLNMDVVGYSGEIYLLVWARDRVKMASGRIMATIKDNLIVSSGASLAAASLLILGLLLTGHIALEDLVERPQPLHAALAGVVFLLVVALVFRFGRVLFSLPRRTIAALGAAHLSRFLVGYALQVLQWWVVIPAASFETWAVLLVVFVVINRIPFLPSSDLVFVSAGVGLTPMLDIPIAPVVGMLLVRSAADRLLNVAFFTGSVWYERRRVSMNSERNGAGGGDSSAVEEPVTREMASPLKT